jgi:hypothetical protein
MSGLEIARRSPIVLMAAQWHAPDLILEMWPLMAEAFWT